MTTKIAVFNSALLHLGRPSISSLTTPSNDRIILDDAYAIALDYCLTQGFWNFAIRTVSVASSVPLAPTFGFTYGFDKPSDWLRTFNISADGGFTTPLIDYADEAGNWYANVDPIYVRYVSNDATSFGGNLTLWTQHFAEYVALRLAFLSCKRMEGAADLYDSLRDEEKRALLSALGKDGMDQPPAFPPRGSWANSRRGSTFSRNSDR